MAQLQITCDFVERNMYSEKETLVFMKNFKQTRTTFHLPVGT